MATARTQPKTKPTLPTSFSKLKFDGLKIEERFYRI